MKLLLLISTLLTALAAAPPAVRAEDPPLELRVKAAFVYNFIQFTQWPADAFADDTAPIVVGILGPDPLKGAMQQAVQGKTVGGREIKVKHGASLQEIGACQVLYVGAAHKDKVPDLLKDLANAPTLTVGETDNMTTSGGIIRFFLEDNRLRFEINLPAAQKRNLQFSSKLLKLARVVEK